MSKGPAWNLRTANTFPQSWLSPVHTVAHWRISSSGLVISCIIRLARLPGCDQFIDSRVTAAACAFPAIIVLAGFSLFGGTFKSQDLGVGLDPAFLLC